MLPNNQQLEKGKFYRTQDGRKVECLATNATTLQPCVCLVYHNDDSATVMMYSLYGQYYMEYASPLDLVSEWIGKPQIDWSDMPIWFNYVAMDESGTWYGYENLPEFDETDDSLWEGYGYSIPHTYHISYFGLPKDSWVVRPGYVPPNTKQ